MFADRIRSKLAALRTFSGETWEMRPVCKLEWIEEKEAEWGVRLPDDYRAFLLEIGNGGAGPDYGLVQLGERHAEGNPANPFAMPGPWNADEPPPLDLDQHPYDGIVLLSDIGCGYFNFLVVNGPRAGEVWCDYTAALSDRVMQPVAKSFLEWYERWLDGEIAAHVVREARNPSLAHADLVHEWEALVPTKGDVVALAGRIFVDIQLGRTGDALGRLEEAEQIDAAAPILREPRRILHAEAFRDAASDDEEARARALRSHVADVREVLAQNPKTSDAMLSILAADASGAVACAVARHEAASHEALGRVFDRLVNESDLRTKMLGLEPIAARLGRVLEDDPLGPWLARAAARRKDANLEAFARHTSACVRHVVALHPALPEALVERLAADPNPFVRQAIAARVDLSADRMRALAGDDSEEVRSMIALHPKASEELLVALCHETWSRTVIFNLGSRPNVPARLKKCLARHPFHHEPQTYDLFGKWPRSATNQYLPLDAPAADAIAARSYSHPSFPEPLMAPLIEEQYGMGGYAMADHPFLSDAMMERLGSHAYDYTRAKIAERWDAAPSLLEKLARDRAEMVRIAASRSHAEDPKRGLARSTPPERLRELARHEDAAMRMWVAMHPRTPSECRAELGDDEDERVRAWARELSGG